MSLRTKIIILFLLVASIPAGIIIYYSYSQAHKALQGQTLAALNVISELREGEVFLYIDKLRSITRNIAADKLISDLMTREAPASDKEVRQLQTYLKNKQEALAKSVTAIDILDISGNTLISTNPANHKRNWSEQGIRLKATRNVFISNATLDKQQRLQLYMAMPILLKADNFNRLIGFTVISFNLEPINKLLTGEFALSLGARSQKRGIGQSGETYLVNEQGLMMTDSLFVKQAPLKQKVDTYPVQQFIKHNRESLGIWMDYRNKEVIGSSMIIDLGSTRWLLLSEQDTSEAFEQIKLLKQKYLLISGISLVLITALAVLISISTSRRINHLIGHIHAINQGQFETEIDLPSSTREFRLLTDEFRQMKEQLNKHRLNMETQTRELTDMSQRDSLTYLYNHRYLKESLASEMQRAERYETSLSCLILDLDHFKDVNDKHGHLYGDYVLKQVADIILQSARKTDICGRYGGEEFMLILPNTNLTEASTAAEKIRQRIAMHFYSHDGVTSRQSASIGVSCYSKNMRDSEDLIYYADKALYRAKQLGRNRVYTATYDNRA